MDANCRKTPTKNNNKKIVDCTRPKLPADWKHGVIVQIAKPGKDQNQPNNYRTIALTSNLCKLMERMVMSRLVHVIEKKKTFLPIPKWFPERAKHNGLTMK